MCSSMNKEQTLAHAAITRERSERHVTGTVESRGATWRFHAIATGEMQPANIDGGHVSKLNVWRQGTGTAFRFEHGEWTARESGKGDLLAAVLALFD